MADAWKDLCNLLEGSGVRVTLSPNCISGIVETCYCCRCMADRGEHPSPETEATAAVRSKVESALFRKRVVMPVTGEGATK